MDALSAILNKIHTTPMGAERIRRNLGITTDDVVSWCRDTVLHAEKESLVITSRVGKNWYIYTTDIVVTINACSYTIITAHKLKTIVRPMVKSDYCVLDEFLYQAIFTPDGDTKPSREIIKKPNISIYIKDFGAQVGDIGVVAERGGQIIGAAWTRIIFGYGRIDDETPELAISILPEYRNKGIGTQLMKRQFDELRKQGYKQTSLSVQQKNTALSFYQRLGYMIIDETDEEYIMVKDLTH